MLWSFEKMYYINNLKQDLRTAKHMSITRFMSRLSLIGIDAIWRSSLEKMKGLIKLVGKVWGVVDEDHCQLPTLYWLPNFINDAFYYYF